MLRPCLLLVDTFHANPRTADGMPVRESRMHQKLKKNGLSFDAEITWWPIPIMTQDEHGDEKVELQDWPMLLPSALARSLTSADLGEYLGPSGPECLQFWNTVLEDYDEESRQKHYCIDPDRAKCTRPIALYGDEGTVLSESTMYYNWSPELSMYRTNSWLSRFFITLMPSGCYVHHGGVNVTIQAINDVITRDCNWLATSGITVGAEAGCSNHKVLWKPV